MRIENFAHIDHNSKAININWGRGRLSGYQSFYGFAAKFCRLNCLSPRSFKKFWQTVIIGSDIFHKKFKAEDLASLLDEPLYLVQSIFEYNYVLSNWPQYTPEGFEFHPNIISFCPICLADAYHASFHEHDWLQKCPIHMVELEKQIINTSVGSSSEKYLACLISLFDSNCTDWCLRDGKYRTIEEIADYEYFHEFLIWIQTSDLHPEENEERWIAEIGFNHFKRYPERLNRGDYFKIKNRLGIIKPFSTNISNILNENGCKNFDYEVQNFSHESVVIIKRSLIFFPDETLVQFFRLTQKYKGEVALYFSYLRNEIDTLNKRHPLDCCDCKWGINKKKEVASFLPGQQKYYGEFMCPYEFAIYELRNKWFGFLLSTNNVANNFIHDEFTFYSFFGQRAVGAEIAKELDTPLKHHVPVYQFTWPSEITTIFDIILLKIVQTHVTELKYWISKIEQGASPDHRVKFEPNIYLVYNENVGLQLISWPTGKEHLQG